jgi:ABC-2 type transport system permease protein
MRQFLEFFLFELKIRFKSISTYVYFVIWLVFSFLCVSSENFGGIASGNGKVFVNGPWANSSNDISASFFGIIIVAAIFGTSILRDFQRDTTQILFTKPISKFAYLGGRWLGSFVVTVFVFFALVPGEMLGTLAPWADHTRIAPAPLSWYLQPFFSIIVVQIFFLGSLFFLVGALSRRVFVVYLQGAAVLALYLFYAGAFISTRSLNRFWPSIFDPVGLLLSDGISRYWTVVDKNTLLFSWSPHVAQGLFLYNRLLWCGFGVLTLAALWAFFPMSLEALTARASSRRARLAAEQDDEIRPVRTLVTTRAPLVQQIFGPATTWAQYWSLTRLRMRNIVRDIPFWVLLILMAGLSCSNGRYAGKFEGENVWPVTYLMLRC